MYRNFFTIEKADPDRDRAGENQKAKELCTVWTAFFGFCHGGRMESVTDSFIFRIFLFYRRVSVKQHDERPGQENVNCGYKDREQQGGFQGKTDAFMKTVFVFRAESVGSYRLIPLHEPHDDIASNQNQTLDHTVGRDNQIRVRQRFCGDICQPSTRAWSFR